MNTRKQHYAMNEKIKALKRIRAKLEQAEKDSNIKHIQWYKLTEKEILADIGTMYLEMRGA